MNSQGFALVHIINSDEMRMPIDKNATTFSKQLQSASGESIFSPQLRMTLPLAARNMPHNNSDTANPPTIQADDDDGLDMQALSPRQTRRMLVCDAVEAVRRMEHRDEFGIGRHWQLERARIDSSYYAV